MEKHEIYRIYSTIRGNIVADTPGEYMNNYVS